MKIEDMILVTLSSLAIIIALWYIFGDSPTIEQVILGLLAVNVGFSFKINGDLQRHLGEHTGYHRAKLNSK